MVQQVLAGNWETVDMRRAAWAGHGLSLLLTAQAGSITHTLLFDAGPHPDLWARNLATLELETAVLEAAVLSHWHPDHSAGLPAVTKWYTANSGHQRSKPLLIDVHPARPIQRGLKTRLGPVAPLNKDPSLQELSVPGLVEVATHSEPHTLLDGYFFVSGAIPRQTDYEKGMANHMRLTEDGSWVEDPFIMDERYLAVNVKGRGPVVFSACSHAGIVNVVRDVKLLSGTSPHGIVGGLHLSSSQCEDRIAATVDDLAELDPGLILAGHCTGWRAKAALANRFPGRFMPCVVGGRYTISAAQ